MMGPKFWEQNRGPLPLKGRTEAIYFRSAQNYPFPAYLLGEGTSVSLCSNWYISVHSHTPSSPTMTSNSLPTATSKDSIDDTESVQHEKDSHTLIDTFLPSTSTYHATPPKGALTTPFCLPQILSGERTPFARGYSNVLLESVDLSMDEFLSFIDGLNLAIVDSPPLR